MVNFLAIPDKQCSLPRAFYQVSISSNVCCPESRAGEATRRRTMRRTTARQPSTWAVEVAKSWWTWSIAMAVVTLTLTTLLLFMVLNPSYFYPMQFFEGDSRTWAVQDQVLKPWTPKAVCCLIQAWLRRQRWLVHGQHPSNGGFGGHHVGNTWRFQSWLMLMAVYTTF